MNIENIFVQKNHLCNFGRMELIINACVKADTVTLFSAFLKRDIKIDFFVPTQFEITAEMSLLLINDGQDMPAMNFTGMLNKLCFEKKLKPLLCVAISANEERKMEYGVAAEKDYVRRGAKAGLYTEFIVKELLPFTYNKFKVKKFTEAAFAGFSLGGLSALDIVWNHPDIFSKVGVFSGSLWWRSKDEDDDTYRDHEHRIMQQQIRNGKLPAGLTFFFQCGKLDEAEDRNNNGIIDAIEDTYDTIHEIINKGCGFEDIAYLEIEDGRHDVPTWGRAMPAFLKWGWGKEKG